MSTTRIGSAAAVVGMALLLGATSASARQDPATASAPRVVDVTARQFAFEPSTIEVTEGEHVRLRVRSADVTHGFEIAALDRRATIPRGGEPVLIDFQAPGPGTYPIACSVYCGAGHESMTGSLVVVARGAGGMDPGTAAGGGAVPAAAQAVDPDLDPNLAQPDFALAALPTTLRVPRYKSAFRVTHRFGRPLGAGDFGDLVEDLFGLDSGALIGLEFRFGLVRGGQIGIHRTSAKTIQFFGQYDIRAQRDGFPVGIAAMATVEGTDNFKESYSPALGLLLSREIADRAALYVEPFWVNNSNPLPGERADDNDTVMVGLGARLRVRPTVYLLVEAAPRLAGHDPGVTHVSFGVEKRAGGHTFQLNVSNNFSTTLAGIARGGFNRDDWFLGFNISRKFF